MYFYFSIYFGSNVLFTSDPGLNLPEQATINYNNVLRVKMCKSKLSNISYIPEQLIRWTKIKCNNFCLLLLDSLLS